MFGHNDLVVRKALRTLLIFQLVEQIPLGALAFLGQTTLALFLLILTILFGLGVVGFAYLRYRGNPKVVEKRSLLQRKVMLEKGIGGEQKKIVDALQRRVAFTHAQRREVTNALQTVQRAYIEEGLRHTLVADADIPGVGPKLKERLIARGVISAADVSQAAISAVEGFGDVKIAAVLAWQNGVYAYLDGTKPESLQAGQESAIAAKYEAQHATNDEEEASAKAAKQGLENDLANHLLRLEPLAPITFRNYIASAMAADSRRAGKMLGALVGVTIAVFALTGVGFVASSGRGAPAQPTPDYNAIGTFALETAVASNLGTLQASSPTAAGTSTVAPRSTAMATALPASPLPITTASVAAAAASFAGIPGTSCIPNNPPQTGIVVSITDGDTIRVMLDRDGKTYSLRYIGIDTPEMDPVGQFFGVESNARNTELAYGKAAILMKDVSETDQYGRLLRYVIVDNVFVNYDLVAGGFARSASYPPDTACIPIFRSAEQQASVAQIGLWAAPPTLVPLATASIFNIAPIPSSGGGCCKHCTNSQPCGNSCISWKYTCHKPPGCACP